MPTLHRPEGRGSGRGVPSHAERGRKEKKERRFFVRNAQATLDSAGTSSLGFKISVHAPAGC
jgi:hypothetical protein